MSGKWLWSWLAPAGSHRARRRAAPIHLGVHDPEPARRRAAPIRPEIHEPEPAHCHAVACIRRLLARVIARRMASDKQSRCSPMPYGGEKG